MPIPKPTISVASEELPELWDTTLVSVIFERPPDFDDGPSLGGRIRGALGPALKQVAANRPYYKTNRLRYNNMPSAFDALFGSSLLNVGQVGQIFYNPARPFVLFVESLKQSRSRVSVRLFGWARYWSEDIKRALIISLENGITVYSGSRVRARLKILQSELVSERPLEKIKDSSETHFLFRSPVRFDRAGRLALDLSVLLSSLTSRAASLAAWHGFVIDVDGISMARDAQSLVLSNVDMMPCPWHRVAVLGRIRKRQIPMLGLLGKATLTGNIGKFAPFVALAQSCHLGSYTSFGLGQVETLCAGN